MKEKVFPKAAKMQNIFSMSADTYKFTWSMLKKKGSIKLLWDNTKFCSLANLIYLKKYIYIA